VLPNPPVKVFLVDFGEHAVTYEIKFLHGQSRPRINEINDAVRTGVWYELKRERINIPYPIRTLHWSAARRVRCRKATKKRGQFCAGNHSFNVCPTIKSKIW